MDWREQVTTSYPNELQKQHRVRVALAQIDEGVATLMSLGFPLHIAEGPPPVVPNPWPKRVFHLRQGERTVACQAELDELGDDWYPSLEAAKHSAGMTKQMQRGGVFSKALPAPLGLLPQPPVQPKDSGLPTEGQKIREALRRGRNGTTPRFEPKEA